MIGVTHRTVEMNGFRMHVAEQGMGPVVILCHGFPESWYSWRHQLLALAEAGFHAVAPDMRGYGQTDRPEAIDQYTLLHLVGDMVGLVDRSRALNIALAAAFLAADNSNIVNMIHLLHATKREYQKMGKVVSESEFEMNPIDALNVDRR